MQIILSTVPHLTPALKPAKEAQNRSWALWMSVRSVDMQMVKEEEGSKEPGGSV